MGDGQFFVTADYLYVRASFSEATAFVRQDLASGTDSSFRSNSITSRRIASAAAMALVLLRRPDPLHVYH